MSQEYASEVVNDPISATEPTASSVLVNDGDGAEVEVGAKRKRGADELAVKPVAATKAAATTVTKTRAPKTPVNIVELHLRGAKPVEILSMARKDVARDCAKQRQKQREAASNDEALRLYKASQRESRKNVDAMPLSATFSCATPITGGGDVANLPMPGVLARFASTASSTGGSGATRSPLTLTPTTLSQQQALLQSQQQVQLSSSSQAHSQQATPVSGTAAPVSVTAQPLPIRDAGALTDRFLSKFTSSKSKLIEKVISSGNSNAFKPVAASGRSPDESSDSSDDERLDIDFGLEDDNAANMMPMWSVNTTVGQAGGGSQSHAVDARHAVANGDDDEDDEEHTRNIQRKHEMRRLQRVYSTAGDGGASQSIGVGGGLQTPLSGTNVSGASAFPAVPIATGDAASALSVRTNQQSGSGLAGLPTLPATKKDTLDDVAPSLQRSMLLAKKGSKVFATVTPTDVSMIRRTNSFESSGPIVFTKESSTSVPIGSK